MTDWYKKFLLDKTKEGDEETVPWWQKYDPFTRGGMASREASQKYGGGTDVTTQKKPLFKPELSEAERYKEYESLPFAEKLLYEAPLWSLSMMPQFSGTALWGAAGKIPAVVGKLGFLGKSAGAIGQTAKVAARIPVAPFYGIEKALEKALPLVGKGIGLAAKYGVGKPYGKIADVLQARTYRGVKQAIEAGMDVSEGVVKKKVIVPGVATGQPFKGIGYRGAGKTGVETPRIHGVSDSYAVGMPETPVAGKTTAEHFAAGVQNQTLKGKVLKAKVVEGKGIVTKKAIDLKNPYVTDPYGDDVIKAIAEKAQKEAKVKGLFGKDFDNYINTAIEKELGRRGFDGRVIKYVEEGYYEVIEFPKSVVKAPLTGAAKVAETKAAKEEAIHLYRGYVEKETNKAVVGLQQVARGAKNITEFNRLIHTKFENPRIITTYINKNYKSIRNFFEIAKSDAISAEIEQKVPIALKKVKAFIDQARKKWQPLLSERREEIGRRAGAYSKVLDTYIDEGKEAFRKAGGALKGKYKTIESAVPGLAKEEEAILYKAIIRAKQTGTLLPLEAHNANTGLEKMLAGHLPQMSEMVEMEKVFGADIIKALLKHRGVWAKAMEQALDVILLPRSLLASGDFSAPLRQGLFLLPSHPIQASKAFVKSVRMFFDKKYYNEVVQQLASRDLAGVGKDHLLFLGSTANVAKGLVAREEAFMSRLAERIPGIGTLVKASERAYVGYLDMFRASVFDATLQGWGVTNTTKLFGTAKAEALSHQIGVLAKYINWSTGRGDLPTSIATGLNAIFFSPRLQTGRIGLPFLLTKMLIAESPALRKVAARDMLAFGGAASTTLGLAWLGGAQVELDPASADFGKVKIGNTRIDMLGGFGQYATYLARNFTGDFKEGRIKASSGRMMKANRGELFIRLLRTKASPAVGAILNTMFGSNVVGEEVELNTDYMLKDLGDNLLMMAWQDIIDATVDSGWTGFMLGMPAIFGAGVQTYDSTEQLVGEVRYFVSRGREAEAKIKEMMLKGEYDKVDKFIKANPEIQYGKMASNAANKIDKIESKIKEIKLRADIEDDMKEQIIEAMQQQQIDLAIPALLSVDQIKLSLEASKHGITIPREMKESLEQPYKSKRLENFMP